MTYFIVELDEGDLFMVSPESSKVYLLALRKDGIYPLPLDKLFALRIKLHALKELKKQGLL